MWGQDYWDIYAAYAEVMKGLSKIGARKIAVESIGIDAWGPGVVCVAGDGLFLGPPRLCGEVLSGAVQAKFFKRMERRDLFETTGVNILDSHAALQMFGLRREKSVALEEAKRLLFIPEAIAYLLFFFIGWFIWRKRPERVGTGFFFGLCLTLIFTFRFFIEFTKDVQVDFEQGMMLDMGQLLSIPFIILGIWCMIRKRNAQK
jgi:hypothetical protein